MTDSFARITDALLASGRELSNTRDDSCMSRCPAHNDGRPSLSIKKIQGSTLLYCMAGCSTADVVDALGMTMSDLFDDELGMSYQYPGGRIVHRTPDKTFKQSGDKEDTSLYHADLLEGPGPIYVVEGEKDVLACESVGAQAVSSPMGASASPAKYDWEPLRGKIVHVVADRDVPGRKRAKVIMEYLEPIAMSISLYEPTEGKDIADHITAGKTLQELKCLASPDILSFSQAIDQWRLWQSSEGAKPIPTPWGKLNKVLAGGLHPGRVYVIGARTGNGKSVAGVNMVSFAAEYGHPSLVVSVEMPHVEISSRIIASRAQVSYEGITTRDFSDFASNAKVDKYIAENRDIPLYICDKATISIEEVAAKSRMLVYGKGLKLLFIDYAQLIRPSNSSTARQEQVSHIARSAKLIAMELEIPVLLAAQLNRNGAAEQRAPRMEDLRESGELEQSADVILLLHRDDHSDVLYVNVPKNRTGKAATVQLMETFAQARID